MCTIYMPIWLNNMGIILQIIFQKWFYFHENYCNFIIISLQFALTKPVDNNSTLIQAMALNLNSNKWLPETMTQFSDAYDIYNQVSVCGIKL